MTPIEQSALLLHTAHKAYNDYITSGRNGEMMLEQEKIDQLKSAETTAFNDLMMACDAVMSISPQEAYRVKVAAILAANQRQFQSKRR